MKKKDLKLKDFLDTDYLGNPKFFDIEIALENVIDGNRGDSVLYHLNNLWHKAFLLLPKQNEEESLFRFTRFPAKTDWHDFECPIIKDIRDNAITLSSPNDFNDPMDPLIKVWLKRKQHNNDRENRILYQLIEKSLDNIRICCLVNPMREKRFCCKPSASIDKCNPLMWAHYADNHKGICIQYRVKPSNLTDSNNRIIRLLDVNYSKAFPLNGDILLSDSLVVKANCWSYENETRLIMYSTRKEMKYCQLEDFEIEAVYMGCRIGPKQRDCLKRMLKDTSVKLFQMSFSNDDITKLTSHVVL